MTIEQTITHATLEERMASWGAQYKAKRQELHSMARAAFAFYVEWQNRGAVGDFSALLAEHSGLSRTTAWRVYRTGLALAHGASPDADQEDLVQAAKALDGGATVEEVNEAMQADRVKDLANRLSLGTVGRQMDVEVADLREQVLNRLGALGMQEVKPKDREAIVYRSFLLASDDVLRSVIQAHAAMTENTAPAE